ncbi:MAG: hypothetical protein GYA30_00420 [Chloroflexi bacterium]|nr:hypothetical protein [Chloroflexota bacterium]OQA94024.1 MAG: hypothetical protein BWY25_03009 [Chloroflexi bacterium ADurb.Bin222]HOC22639.1 hypothetical protein [Anaerolineae bacterium]HQM15548.1 hypothetical protein [Anaerolineae bacterium]
MQVKILDEQHNAASWELRRPVVEIELGILGGMLLIITGLFFVQSAVRWPFIAGVATLALGAAFYVAFTTPLWERGAMERTPEGGTVTCERRWLLHRELERWEVPLESVESVGVMRRTVEETDGHVVSAARCYVRLAEGGILVPLTGWATVESATQLAQNFARAARVPVEAA